MCKGLREAGNTVWVIATVGAGNLVKDEYGTSNIPPYFEPYAKTALKQYIKGLNIDCVITIIDCWMQQTWDIPDIVHKFKIPIIAHVTARSYPISPWWGKYLNKCDHIIAPSKFGMNAVRELFPKKTSYIQHGVNLDIFKPDKKAREEIRKRLGYEDKFVFLAVGRNKGIQKRWDIMLKAYKTLLMKMPEAKKDTVLHMHTNPHEPNAIDLEQLRNIGYSQIGKEHIVFSTVRPNGENLEICRADDSRSMLLNPNWGLSEIEMAKLYNMAD